MGNQEPTTNKILELRNLTIDFGGVRAVNDLTLSIAPGELIGLIGPNGAGKTTVFNLITNAYQATSGDILLEGKSIRGLSPDKICRLGISRTFQNIRLFPHMTAYENVELGLHAQPHYSLFESFVRTPRAARAEREARETGPRAAGDGQPGRARQRHGGQPALRPPAPPRDRPRHGRRSEDPAPGRTGRRHERGRVQGPGQPHPPDPSEA